MAPVPQHCKYSGQEGRDRAPPHLQALIGAAEASRSVGFTYHSPEQGGMARQLDPYGVVFRQGRWYLTGFCHLRSALRSFRLDRISDVHLLPGSFQRPPGFDAAEFLNESFRSWGGGHEVSLLLHTDRATAVASLGCHSSCLEGPQEADDRLLLTTRAHASRLLAACE